MGTIQEIRAIIGDKTILNEHDRAEMEIYVKNGLPAEVRAEFWNACTGVKMYQNNYVDNYYSTLQYALEYGVL